MEKKYTPAPWKAYEQEHTQNADRSYWHIDGGQGYYRPAIGPGFSVSGIMSEEDARLMAAAPSLLESLIQVVSEMEITIAGQEGYYPALALAKAVIQKAIGANQKAESSNPTGVLLQVDGHTCTWEEFERENTGEGAVLDIMDLERVSALRRGERVFVGIQEVKRIQ